MVDEGGAGNDFTEIYVRDERNDNRRRPLSDATVPGARILGTCQGRKLWLGPRIRDACEEPNRLLTRSASNAYFSQTLSVIHIPDAEAALKEAVDTVFEDFLQYCESAEDVTRERRKQRVLTALEGHSDAVAWADIQRRKGGAPAETRSIKQAEFETLMASTDSMGEDVPGGDFYARARSLGGLPAEFEGRLDRVVLVHRLREVVAQVGSTRFESALPDIDGELPSRWSWPRWRGRRPGCPPSKTRARESSCLFRRRHETLVGATRGAGSCRAPRCWLPGMGGT